MLIDLLAKIDAVKGWLNEHSVIERDYPRALEVLEELQLQLHKKIDAEMRAMFLTQVPERDFRQSVEPKPDYLVWNEPSNAAHPV